MVRLRLIQGGVTATSWRALLLARAAGQLPAVSLTEFTTGRALPVSVRQLPDPASELRRALDCRGVQAYLLEAASLAPGQRYRLQATTPAASVRVEASTLPAALPPEPGLSIAVASCYYDGFHRDGTLGRSLALPRRDHQPAAFHIWAGDNVYMDIPADPLEDRPVDHSLDRYLAYLLDSGYGQVRALAPSFTTYDDHEYWNNFPESVQWLSRSWEDSYRGYRSAAGDCLQLFQSNLNPSGGKGFFGFSIAPLHFLFLDCRSARSRTGVGPQQLLAPEAMAALRDFCRGLTGPGVLVLGQPLWIDPGGPNDRNLPAYRAEYAAIWSHLRDAPYDVLVVSGDTHHSRLLKIAFTGTVNRNVYEFVSSPACHIPTSLSTFGLGNAQDQGDLDDVPGRVQNAGQALAASYFFGTDSANSFGMLRFCRVGADAVRVGASFIEHFPRDGFARAKTIDALPRATARAYGECHESRWCVLRQR